MGELSDADLKKQRGCALVLVLTVVLVIVALVLFATCGGFYVPAFGP